MGVIRAENTAKIQRVEFKARKPAREHCYRLSRGRCRATESFYIKFAIFLLVVGFYTYSA
jgi:hypothetical protein